MNTLYVINALIIKSKTGPVVVNTIEHGPVLEVFGTPIKQACTPMTLGDSIIKNLFEKMRQ